MAIVVQFIKEYAQWVYGVCALIALWYLRASLLARRDRRYAVFSLEREAALNRTYGAWTVAIVLLVVIGAIYFLSTVVSDAVAPLVEAENTPTPPAQQVVQVTPQPTLPLPEALLETPRPTPTPTRAATPRPRPTQAQPTVPAPAAAAPAVQSPSCPDPRAIITAPGINQRVSGMVPIMGTAASDKFQYYKLEFGAGINPGVWSYFAGGEKSVRGGQLGTLNSGSLAPGPYTIRVVVVDTTGNYAPPCQTVVIIN
jgi:hypothetical protein